MTFYDLMTNGGVKPLVERSEYANWRGCSRKRRYSTYEDAKAAVYRVNGLHGTAYACEHCTGFHIGHSPLNGKSKIRTSH